MNYIRKILETSVSWNGWIKYSYTVEYFLVVKYIPIKKKYEKSCRVKKSESDEYIMIPVWIWMKSPVTNISIKQWL